MLYELETTHYVSPSCASYAVYISYKITVRFVWVSGGFTAQRASDANDISPPVSLNKLLKNMWVADDLTRYGDTRNKKIQYNFYSVAIVYRILTRNSIKYKP